MSEDELNVKITQKIIWRNVKIIDKNDIEWLEKHDGKTSGFEIDELIQKIIDTQELDPINADIEYEIDWG